MSSAGIMHLSSAYRKLSLLIIIAILFIAPSLSAQISEGGTPPSWGLATAKRSAAEVKLMPPVDVSALLAQDSIDGKRGIPFRFGYPFDVDYTMNNSGTWIDNADGSRTWQLEITCPGAYSTNLLYDYFWLPPGAEFYVYSMDHSQIRGAFTSRNNKAYHTFATAPVKGESCELEYWQPAGTEESPIINISRIVHDYRDIFDYAGTKFKQAGEAASFGSSGSCNNNVNCPVGVPWQDEKRGVAMILLSGGTRWCTGSLINNVREDFTPYFLTANHCLGGEGSWIFMFNYESPGCTNIDGPTNFTVQGSTLLATNSVSDFALLELTEQPPDSYMVYFNGWSALDVPSQHSVVIHHPSGDIKKISFDDDPVVSATWSGSPNTHWEVINYEDGTTEPGSSGSPLFNPDHQIVGQLHGGTASCTSNTEDLYGKFSRSWDGGASPTTRLVDWLDPDNTGATTLEGLDPSGVSFSATPTIGWVPFDVTFTGSSTLTITSWKYYFGDGDSALVQSPVHNYTTPGVHDVTLTVETSDLQTKSRTRSDYIIGLADTLRSPNVDTYPGAQIEVTITGHNTQSLTSMSIPIEYGGTLALAYDSFSTVGCRTDYFATQSLTQLDPFNQRLNVFLQSGSGGANPLAAGEGPVLKLYLTVDVGASTNDSTTLSFDGYSTKLPNFTSPYASFEPAVISPIVSTSSCCLGIRGNVTGDGQDQIDIADLTFLVGYMFKSGEMPPCLDEANIDGIGGIDVADLTYLVAYMFKSGPDPAACP